MVVPVSSDKYTGASELHPPTRAGPGDTRAAMMSLRYRLADEIANLRSHAVEWRGGERKVRFWTKVIVWIVKGML
jgi:CDP-diacylglycerol--glycerol-3-phosphate 3-phosphatidyltransferase